MRRWYPRRWPPRAKAFLMLSIASGLGALLLVRSYQVRLETLAPQLGEPVPVVVATRFLARGDEITEEALAVERVPAAFAPPGALGSVQAALGRTLASDLLPGEALTETRLASGGGPVASQVPSGLRAFVVPSGLPPGAVRPGDRVDVLATFGGQRPYTDTVASGLEVLSVLRSEEGVLGGAPHPQGASLVLLVSREAAERLAHATAFGHLTVTIAGTQD